MKRSGKIDKEISAELQRDGLISFEAQKAIDRASPRLMRKLYFDNPKMDEKSFERGLMENRR